MTTAKKIIMTWAASSRLRSGLETSLMRATSVATQQLHRFNQLYDTGSKEALHEITRRRRRSKHNRPGLTRVAEA